MSASYERGRLESRLADPLRGLLPVIRSCVRWARRPMQPAVRLWRRNLQLRVVAVTLLMSVVWCCCSASW